jgi:hypothetical protein
MAEHGTPDLISSRAPVHSGVGSKIGYHHHQLCRPAFNLDARQFHEDSQVENYKKLVSGLQLK